MPANAQEIKNLYILCKKINNLKLESKKNDRKRNFNNM